MENTGTVITEKSNEIVVEGTTYFVGKENGNVSLFFDKKRSEKVDFIIPKSKEQ